MSAERSAQLARIHGTIHALPATDGWLLWILALSLLCIAPFPLQPALAGLAGLSWICRFAQRSAVVRHTAAWTPIVLSITGALVGLTLSPVPAPALERFLSLMAILSVGLCVIEDHSIRSTRAVFAMAPLMIAAVFLGPLVGTAFLVKWPTAAQFVVIQGEGSTSLPTINSNGLSVGVFVLVIYVAAFAQHRGSRLIAASIGVPAVLLLAGLGSRGTWISGALTAVILFAHARHFRPRDTAMIVAGCAGLLAALVVAFEPHFPETVPAARLYIALSSVQMLAGHLLTGVGLAAFPLSYADYIYPQAPAIVDTPHNSYLSVALNGGILALIGLIAAIRSVFRSGLHSIQDLETRALHTIAYGVTVFWCFDSVFEDLSGGNWGLHYLEHSMALPTPVLLLALIVAIDRHDVHPT